MEDKLDFKLVVERLPNMIRGPESNQLEFILHGLGEVRLQNSIWYLMLDKVMSLLSRRNIGKFNPVKIPSL